MKLISGFLAALLLFSVLSAATIEGNVYGPDLELAKGAVVSINTTPKQQVVAKEGRYSFNTSRGSFLIEAYYFEDGGVLRWNESVTVEDEGRFVLDLILLPEFEDIEDLQIEGPDIPEEQSILPLLGALAAIGAVGGAYLHIRRKRRGVSKDCLAVLDILKANEGRMRQKELRELLRWSEAKLSLIVSELESEGFVKKIKQGRGNIIILKSLPPK